VESFKERDQTIPADLRHLRGAREFAESAARDFGLDGEGAYRAKLAISEVVANAVVHGSRDPEDPIELTAADEGGALAFYVKDTGRFVPRVPARGALPERGRGLDFVRTVMDEVDIRPGSDGTTVRLVLRAPAAT
jgi:anti-sigma regulatory factor (Ser/Thr protein kinase)